MDCKERCVCNFINGTAVAKCSSLCTAPVDSLCKANTQQIEVYEQSLGGTNCSCQGKRCIPGLKLFRNNHPHMPLNRFFNTFKIEWKAFDAEINKILLRIILKNICSIWLLKKLKWTSFRAFIIVFEKLYRQ